MESLEKAIVSTIWGQHTYEKHKGGKLPKELLMPYVPAIKTLSERYVNPKRRNTRPRLDRELVTGYMLYYLPINFFKVSALLSHVQLQNDSQPIRVLDIGAGPGTASLATLLAFPQYELDLCLIEPCPHMQHRASQLINECTSNRKISHSLHTSLESINSKSFHLIMMSNVLNECSPEGQASYLEAIGTLLSPEGFVIILEPALQTTTRALMHIRDELVSDTSGLSIHFPCCHQNPCPMLTHSEHDWCHQELRWTAPPLVEQMDSLVGFNKHRIKTACLVASRKGTAKQTLRIVSLPTHNKLGASCLVCGEGYYGKLQVPKKHPAFKTVKKANMYDELPIHLAQELL